jgi:outer membrane lipase/esterase
MEQRANALTRAAQTRWRCWRGGIAAAAVAVLLAACGGSDPYEPGQGSPSGAPTTPPSGGFTALVSFGDSLSDIGAYAPATSLGGNGQPPYFGGKFTTNGPGGTVWVENLASALGLVVTPAEVGFGRRPDGSNNSVKCPVQFVNPALATTCTAYGQGGSRVTNPDGIGKAGGALTVPLKAQIASHLERFGAFTANDLVVVFGGNNDAFVEFGKFTVAAQQVQAQAAAGQVTEDQAKALILGAELQALGAMKQAALELSAYVKDDILAKGGRYVVVWNLPDPVLTPFGAQLPASVQPVLTAIVDNFNFWLREGLTGQPVRLVDANAYLLAAYHDPGKYGFTNIAVPACDAAKIAAITGGAVTDGSSLFCNATPGAPFNGLRDGADVDTWQFADGVHPTRGGHRLISDVALQELQAYGWR